ncbi:hypothetical protein [Mycolicibacterium septicum]|uniref:hypothetical protein n=1 Tax=Mycolicibacterium septicum TaxID=98668 RepID=UPI001AF7EA2A|nr:hypothetical protein [Mycolicibacterium septicum]QRY53812.1 hypothetical protein JVX95_11090 [Mycolicibacterium septicum]
MTTEDDEVRVDQQSRAAASAVPVTGHYAPLVWDGDTDGLDEGGVLEAEGDDWRYTIDPVQGSDGAIAGYHVSGRDCESGDQIGSVQIDGKRGELTLETAKAAADANYASRYCEAEQFLDELLDDWEDDDGVRNHRNEQGGIVCPMNELDVDEVEVVVTLADYGDGYDPASRSVTVCLRTVLSFSANGDPGGLVDDLRRLIRLEVQRGRQ